MIVQGTIITPTQLRAAQSAMAGEFTRDTVFNALCAANVPWKAVAPASSRLLRRALDTGSVRPIDGRRFAKVG
jgi:hypothetical protein